MVDLLKEKWAEDGVAAVFSKTVKNVEGSNVRICDLDHGFWDTDELDMDDVCSFARLIAHAPDMLRLLYRIAKTGETVEVGEINSLLGEIL